MTTTTQQTEKQQRSRQLAADRKRRQRQREAALNLNVLSVHLEPIEKSRLSELCTIRAIGTEPYSTDEYLSTLIARDWERWQREKTELAKQPPCKKCNAHYPQSCDGFFRGDAECFLTYDAKNLRP